LEGEDDSLSLSPSYGSVPFLPFLLSPQEIELATGLRGLEELMGEGLVR
jgi:hypothetical protein